MTKIHLTPFVPALIFVALSGCDPASDPVPEPSAQEVYFERLTLLCGKAYSGKLVSNQDADAAMAGKPMIMHVSKCDLNEIQIPFHIGEENGKWNRSRTWTITRVDDGLRLKHRHRHEDGKLDEVTNYGGDTADEGSEQRQEFLVDQLSIDMFKKAGLDQSVTNIWAMEISPPGKNDARFAYELKRPKEADDRFFRVEFDLSKPIDPPPPPWGD
ncbi:FIG00637492: hypothetical protein [hydrothermal vent metagenome]|uniref:Secreted protein n=1 Tax=hydrothermal vent metagenome TaxID=652676 RepID=A0A3B0RTG3_9ZZZZ